MENKAKIITVAGKGGVGKTSICACIVRLLAEKYPDKKILAIDADPAVGLSVALGVDVKLTLDDIRMSIVDSVENGETKEALELLPEGQGHQLRFLGVPVDGAVEGRAHLREIAHHSLSHGFRFGEGRGGIVKIDRIHGYRISQTILKVT